MLSSCWKRKEQKQSISCYINDLKNLDHTLDLMINRVQQDMLTITKNQKPTKHLARRRLMYKKHIQNIENRRNNVLARILQLENLHLNEMQVQSLRSVAQAHRQSKLETDDVEDLIDKLETFKEDFEEINNSLTRDLDFETLDIDEEELMKELEDCISEKAELSVKSEKTDSDQVELVVFPEVPVNENKKDVWQRRFFEKVRTVGV